MKTGLLLLPSSLHLRQPPPPPPSILIPVRLPANLWTWKRRRIKILQPKMSVSIEGLVRGIISVFPSVNSLDLIVPALGFASGAALFVSADRRMRWSDGGATVAGNWILFSSPTPFNRSVVLRCPTISFEDGGELLDGVNERLVEEDRHFVVLNRGRIPVSREAGPVEEEIVYQRVCVRTEDGGVIALDWPENLDLEKELGLDATVLLVPGTTEGSWDRDVRAFVREALRHGCFPVVMNPRGCAGSPVITPRLFTAADSDDVCTTVQFIKQSRPWATLISVGWGYGSNMLTKYLSDTGDQTSVTAAVCINNPFDLDQATKSHPHGVALDQKLVCGLVDILQANKAIFQGKRKGFNVERALSATSVRDFDRVISMISYGCEAIGEFYSKCSTRQSISSVKIPILFIQSDDRILPLFSIPRSSIVENPFTSLLMCSCLPQNVTTSERSTISWCQHLAIEWLQAVELALLKGRHPLLEAVDISLNPSYDLPLPGARPSGSKIDGKYPSRSQNSENEKHISKLPQSNSISGYFKDPLAFMIDESNKSQRADNSSIKEININGDFEKDTSVVIEKVDGVSDNENSQALATAAVVLNMLDVTMPGTLDNEQRRKVLTAVDHGETLAKALQGAVPEDVRGRLTSAISEIVRTQWTGLNLDGLIKLGWSPDLKLDMKSKIQERFKGTSRVEVNELQHQQKNVVDDEMHADSAQVHSDGSNTTGESTTSQERTTQNSEVAAPGPERESNLREINATEEGGVVKEAGCGQDAVLQSHTVAQLDEDGQMVAQEANDIRSNRLKKGVAESGEVTKVSPTGSDADLSLEKERNEADKREAENGPDKVDQNMPVKPESPSPLSSPSSINVSETLDAFISFDDSTQMAVNSVFGVIENMIDQLEKKSDGNVREENRDMNSKTGAENKDMVSKDGNEKGDKNPKSVEENRHKDQQAAFSEPPANVFRPKKIENDIGGLNLDSEVAESSKKLHDISMGCSSTPIPDVKWDEVTEFTSIPMTNTSTYDADINNAYKTEGAQKYPLQLIAKANWESSYNAYPHRYFSSQRSLMRSIDMQKTTDLFLDTEKGHWKMSDQQEKDKHSLEETRINKHINGQGENLKPLLPMVDWENVFEPSHLILDDTQSKLTKQTNIEPETVANNDRQNGSVNVKKEELMWLVGKTILDTLTIEVKRTLGIFNIDMEPELASDLVGVASAVSHAILQDNDQTLSVENEGSPSKFGTVQVQLLINTIFSAVQNADSLRNALPIGVIVGSSLASLRVYFDIADVSDSKHVEDNVNVNMQVKLIGEESDVKNEIKEHTDANNLDGGNTGIVDSHNNEMVGALTAVMCASAVLAYHRKDNINGTYEMIISGASNDVGDTPNETDKVEGLQDTDQNNLVNSIAEKAMSVAAPVVPTKSDGEFDAERLMSVLAELGQKGGLLRFFGNVALLWGGMRGAVSLTDRLIHFLRIAERPLFHRIFGFFCMVLLMWSPVAIPLLPQIVQSWTANSSTGIAGYASLAGLHVATFILIMLWGKRIREYEYPLKQYGLDLSLILKVNAFIKGLIGGTVLVLFVHLVNALLGHACFVRPLNLPPFSAGATALMKAYGKLLLFFVRGFVTASSVAIMEELLFRSWLPNEISVDLGNHWAIVLSGLAFALFQRSLSSIPGFLFLSLALFGAKQRDHGSLYIPIGLRTGIILVSFLIQNMGFVTYKPSTPFWLDSAHSWHPFDGAVGLIFCIVLAMLLYPKQPLEEDNVSTNGQEQKGDV